jgi:ketosteroid isomerase-like protein
MIEKEIADLEDKRFDAMVRADTRTLDDMLDDELVYTHSFGDKDSKSEYLQKVREKFFDYLEMKSSIDKIIEAGDCVLVFGRYTGRVVIQGAERSLNNASLVVWRRTNGAWRLVASQPTVLPR